MSHPQPPQRQPTPTETFQYARALHNTALIALVACPVLALIPPRKLDFYTFGLVGTSAFSANFLVREQTGRSIWRHISPGRNHPAGLYREPQQAKHDPHRVRDESGPVTEEVQSQREIWKAQREKEIKEDLEEGKGLGDMIMEQIWEVWNWGKTKDDEDD